MAITPESISTNYLHFPPHPPFILSSFKDSVFIKHNSSMLVIVLLLKFLFPHAALLVDDRTKRGYWLLGRWHNPADLQSHKLSFQNAECLELPTTARLTCGKMYNPHSTVSFVDVLPSCSFGPECVYTQIFGIHFNINLKSKKTTVFCSS